MSTISTPVAAPVAAPVSPVAPAVEAVAAPAPEKAKKKAYKAPTGEALRAFHARAVAASGTMTVVEFAKSEGSLANQVQANLFKAIEQFGLEIPRFQPEVKSAGAGTRPRKDKNRVELYLYEGRAKTPYVTSRPIPKHILAAIGANANDSLSAEVNAELGTITLTLVRGQAAETAEA